MNKKLFLVGTLILSGSQLWANPILFATPPGLTEAGHPVNILATFDLQNNLLTVTVQNLQVDPVSDDQNLAYLTFDVGDALSNVVFTSSARQVSITGNSPGGYTTTGLQTVPWSQTASGAGNRHIALCDFNAVGCGGQGSLWPAATLVGAPNASNAYASANSSLTNKAHTPLLWESATFTISALGLKPSSTINNVVFGFGTAGTEQVTVASTPEPVPFALLASGIGLLLIGRRRLHRG